MKSKNIVMGILAHVDAGKTTLAEQILYRSGTIKEAGRVDHGDTFLDTHPLEKERGITIFSKEARLVLGDYRITLLDTPGHRDFGTEMERTLQVLDYAILVLNSAEPIQSHTRTVWKLLAAYDIPVFIFVNKMDQPGRNREELMKTIRQGLSGDCVDFGTFIEASQETAVDSREKLWEELAVRDEELLTAYLEGSLPKAENIQRLIACRKVFPCYFGSALKGDGVEQLLEGLRACLEPQEYSEDFGARVFKIGRDRQNNRLTYVKITGGSLKVKQLITGKNIQGEVWEEKADQLRLYSGNTYTTAESVEAGSICTLTGLSHTYAGQGLGEAGEEIVPVLEPVLTYRVILPEEISVYQAYEKLALLAEEEPQLHVEWKEALGEIHVRVMGEIQLEVLKTLIQERFGFGADFDSGHIVYKETITRPVEGVGHFEPLRHYAEVHLLMEPLPFGSGLQFATECSEDILDRNWQRLILTHLEERQHPGVLIGAPITDMRITLVTGRAHPKHTEGGDFRQAVYRAIRQGLRKTNCCILEPMYEYTLELPRDCVGRAMTDIQRMQGSVALSQEKVQEEGMALLTGTCPVSTMQEYSKEVLSYSKGRGRLNCRMKGYEPCHNEEQVIAEIGYQPDKDLENPGSSVFVRHGAGMVVEWDQVEEFMHLPFVCSFEEGEEKEQDTVASGSLVRPSFTIDNEEIDRIMRRTFYANQRGETDKGRNVWKKTTASSAPVVKTYKAAPKKEAYLLVDGYNVIFAWSSLNELAKVSLDGARGRLMDILCDYQAMKGCRLILVFDAYRIQGHPVEELEYHNIQVVYTKEAQTADQYIEKFAHQHGEKYDITVATSDGLEQVIIRGAGCRLLSARDLQEEIERTREQFMLRYGENH